MSADEKKKPTGEKETQINQALIKSGLYVQRELNQVCQQFGLNTNQFSALNEIVTKGPLSQKKLCEKLLFEKSNISKIIKTLLHKGLVNVIHPPEDRRLTLLVETHKGLELWKCCMQDFSQSSIGLISALTDKEARTLLIMLKKLEDEFRRKTGS